MSSEFDATRHDNHVQPFLLPEKQISILISGSFFQIWVDILLNRILIVYTYICSCVFLGFIITITSLMIIFFVCVT